MVGRIGRPQAWNVPHRVSIIMTASISYVHSFDRETALDAFGDVPDGRLVCYTTVREASDAYADASSAGEVIARQ